MRLLIIEDEKPALERLTRMVNQIDPQIEIAGKCGSVKESVKWLKENELPDLILLDIQLSDGLSLEIFKHVEPQTPVVFTTAYDEHILEAFNFNAIDYLLKPIKKERLSAAITRYKNLKTHFSKDIFNVLEQINKPSRKFKQRYLVKSGSSYQSILIDEIAFFYTEHKVSFLVDKKGTKYITDNPLSKIESEVDPNKFFRLNRQFIVNINSIKKIKSIESGKLSVELHAAATNKLIVSQDKAADFKIWLDK
jgi:two-component system LytT family response regulator